MEPTELIKWIEQTCTITQGPDVGAPFKLLAWQAEFIRGAFTGNVADLSALSMGRGGGKSTFSACLGYAALAGPLAQARGDCVIVASSFNQARIVFESILAQIPHEARKRYRILDNAQSAMLEDKNTRSRVRCLGSDVKRLHGLQPSLVIGDEPAQWEQPDKVYNVLTTALGKLAGARMILIGTRAESGSGHFFDSILSKPAASTFVQLHAASPEQNPHSRNTWLKANPSLDAFPALMAAYEKDSERAKIEPAFMPAFQALRLNLGVPDASKSLLLTANAWRNMVEQSDAHLPSRVGKPIWAFDLGTNYALSACAAYWPDSGLLDCFAAAPMLPSLQEKGAQDHVGDEYVLMAQRKELLQLGMRVVDLSALCQEALERFGPPAAICVDRWRLAELQQTLEALHIRAPLIDRGQGFKDGAADVRDLRTAVADGKVKTQPSLLLRAAFRECVTVSDPAGNEKIAKGSDAGRRKRAKDDAAVAVCIAVAEGYRRSMMPVARPARFTVSSAVGAMA